MSPIPGTAYQGLGDLAFPLWSVCRARAGLSLFEEEFEAAHAHGGLWVPVMHPFCTGRAGMCFTPSWKRSWRSDVLFAPTDEIAAHARAEIYAGPCKAMVEVLPQYEGPVGRVFGK